MADQDKNSEKQRLRDALAQSLFVTSAKFKLKREGDAPAPAATEAPLIDFQLPDGFDDGSIPDLAGLDEIQKTLDILTTADGQGSEFRNTEAEKVTAQERAWHTLRLKLVKMFSQSEESLKVRKASDAEAERICRSFFVRVLDEALAEEHRSLTVSQKADFLQSMVDEVQGFGPLSVLLRDPATTEVMVCGPRTIFIEKKGRLQLSDVRFFDDDHLMQVISRIANRIGRQIDLANPYVDARLPDGSRVHAIIPPLAIDGAAVTIRKFTAKTLQMEDMLSYGALTPEMAFFLGACVKARLNILVAGGTGTGKTTMLNVLSTLVQPEQRIVTIEDAAELKVKESHPHVVRLETRVASSSSGGRGGVTIRDLVKCSLRMRPDRVIVGECRGGEAMDMLQAMNTGHDGSMTTAHANSAREMLARLETMCLMSGVELPAAAIRRQISSAIELLVHLKRYADGSRKVSEICEVEGFVDGEIKLRQLFWYEAKSRDEKGKVHGEFKTTDKLPAFIYKFDAEGLNFPYEIFQGGKVKEEDLTAVTTAPPPVDVLPAKAAVSGRRISQAFNVDLSQIGIASAWTMGVLAAWNFPPERVAEAELAIAEASGNIVRHAFSEGASGVMEIEIVADDERFRVTLIDSGKPFDPTTLAPIEREGDTEHGMGLSLIASITDGQEYEYRDGTNRYTLIFNLFRDSVLGEG